MCIEYLTAQHTLITYTSIIKKSQAGFLSENTVTLAHLYCYLVNKEK